MIRYLSTPEHSGTMGRWVKVMGPRLPVTVELLSYDPAMLKSLAGPATYIFSDLERIPGGRLDRAARAWSRLEKAGGSRLLNHPTRAMRRYELLRSLYEAGINEFDIYRLTEARRPKRYPIFVRREDTHGEPRSPLIANEGDFDRLLRKVMANGVFRDTLVAIEYCDTVSEDGVRRKYGCSCIGDRIVPSDMMHSTHPFVKAADSVIDEMNVAEESRYLEENPHAEKVAEIFKLAQIDYGRMDYGLRNGRLQVWEINTNPNWVPSNAKNPLRRALLERRWQRTADAVAALDRR